MFKKILRGFLAAVTSTEAVKLEKSLVVLVVVRVALAAGASASFINLLQNL